MPRNGSLVLSDVRAPTMMIVCEPCRRRGQYNVERLMAEHGDAKLTDLLTTLADCPRARVASIYDTVQDGLRGACGALGASRNIRSEPTLVGVDCNPGETR
jgi:hypothetical protein